MYFIEYCSTLSYSVVGLKDDMFLYFVIINSDSWIFFYFPVSLPSPLNGNETLLAPPTWFIGGKTWDDITYPWQHLSKEKTRMCV